MKSFTLVFFISIFFLVSCKKDNNANNTNNNPGGSWTFLDTTYNTYICIGTNSSGYGTLFATSSTGSNPTSFSTVKVVLGNSIYFSNGTYTIVNNSNPVGFQAQIVLTADGSNEHTYYSTGGEGHQTIVVTADSSNVGITGTAIEMFNGNNPMDSTVLKFSISEK